MAATEGHNEQYFRKAELWSSLDRIPKLLFRTYAPSSAGKVEITEGKVNFNSAASCWNGNGTPLLEREPLIAKDMLEQHILWKNLPNDNLISWTSSLFFAIQHGIRRNATDYVPTSPEDTYICILDTCGIRPGTFLPAVPLMRYLGIEDRGKLGHRWCRGEYFAEGHLILQDVQVRRISLQQFINAGLYELVPEFADITKRDLLARRVEELRGTLHNGAPSSPSWDEIELARRIATQVVDRSELQLMLTVALLSLKRRPRSDFRLREAFETNGLGNQIRVEHLDSYATAAENVPEYKQFIDMMHDIYAHQQRCKELPEPGPANALGATLVEPDVRVPDEMEWVGDLGTLKIQ